jgi:hypothetical protein
MGFFIVILNIRMQIVKTKFIQMRRSLLFLLPFLGLSIGISAQQIENPGFEFWENAGTVKDEPVDWSSIKTCDDPVIASVAPVTFDQSTDAHSGNYALKIYNVKVFGFVATGAISNGRFHAEMNLDSSFSYTDQANPLWNTVFTTRPDSLAGWFKFFPNDNDIAQFKVILHVDDGTLPENGTLANWVGMAYYKTESGVTYDTWTRFSVPFEYYNNSAPEFLLCVINSGDSTDAVDSSYLLTDDLELIYKSSGIDEPVVPGTWIISQRGRLEIGILSDEEFLGRPFVLVSLTGQTVFSSVLSSRQITLPTLPPGVYIATLKGKSRQFNQKIMIR